MKGNKAENIRLIITGGGTGGHLFPGIATAQAMIDKYPGCEVLFIGTERKVDKTALADLGFETTTIKSQGIKDSGSPLPGPCCSSPWPCGRRPKSSASSDLILYSGSAAM